MAFELDPYSELGLSTSASSEDIKSAYRRIARRLHPDVNQFNVGASAQFQEISAAYELLMDENKRRKYDSEMKAQSNDSFFTFRVTTSKRSVQTLPESQVIYMLAEMFPDPRAQQQQQQPVSRLNLTLALDRSNSMNGKRLDKVKVAAHQIIDNLSADDIFSVVSFNDRAEVVIEAAPVKDKATLKARISMMTAFGGTEIFQGLSAGVEQNRKFLAPRLVNHIILLTDGNTYGDQQRSVELATAIATEGISISAMGLGQDWNDTFLDKLASSTGGVSQYINAASEVVRFLNDHVRSLSNVFAERIQISIAPDPDIRIESVFRLAPNPQPLMLDSGYIPLGSLQFNRNVMVLFQLELPANIGLGFRPITRFSAVGDILGNSVQKYKIINDMSIEIIDQPSTDQPPNAILDALGKLRLYRLQERAQDALARGDVKEATRTLENLATRLLEIGENNLAQQAQSEAQQVAYTSNLSDKGRKSLKYDTRLLLLNPEASEGKLS